MMQSIAERLDTLPQVGRLEWIGLAPKPIGHIVPVLTATLIADRGLDGDHHSKRKPGGNRQVTLIQHEHFAAIAGLLHRESVTPAQLRRNLVVSGINLLALKGKHFGIGECILEHTGPCDPCSRMEDAFGPGGLNAIRGHGGITARVIVGGVIAIGDAVRLVSG